MTLGSSVSEVGGGVTVQLLTVSSAKAAVQAFPVGLRKQGNPLMHVSEACRLRNIGHSWVWSDIFTRPQKYGCTDQVFSLIIKTFPAFLIVSSHINVSFLTINFKWMKDFSHQTSGS